MRFASLGSGSRGNATLISHQDTHLLVDCGFSARDTEQRLQRLAMDAASLSGILVTHEHSDHIRGVGQLARKFKIPVWLTSGTEKNFELGELPARHILDVHNEFEIGDLSVCPYPVPHDAGEPCQFVFSDGTHKLGVLTDTGMITPHIESQLSGCDALLLECNHDPDMLANGVYPWHLKKRVGGDYGHLSNEQAAQCLLNIDCSRLKFIAAMHLSEKNNAPHLAQLALSDALDCEMQDILIADQDDGLQWESLN